MRKGYPIVGTETNPKQITVYGRLSFPNFTHAQAVARNATSNFKKADPADVAPDFNLLLEERQLDKLTTHLRDVFLPYCAERYAAKETRDALAPKDIKKILEMLDSRDFEDQPPWIALKTVGEKTLELAPESLASLKVVGNKGQDIQLMAIVNGDEELAVPDPDQVKFPVVKPIHTTVHQMYGGCYVAATLNLYAFDNGGASKGFSASAGVAVFKMEGERFGGGASVDEDEIFLD